MANNSNAIGTGSLILTANADQMLAGMDKAGAAASRKASQISKNVSKASGGGESGGGILGMLGGLAGSGVGGLAGGAIGGAIFASAGVGIREFLHLFEALDERATGFDKGALTGIKNTMKGIADHVLDFAQMFISAAAPSVMVLGDALQSIFDKLKPLVQGAADVFEVFAFTVAEVISQLVDSIGDLGIDTSDWGKTALMVLREVAKAFAFVWDVVKPGVGIVAAVVGKIIEIFGQLGQVVADGVDALARLGKELGVSSPLIDQGAKWFRQWQEGTERIGKQIHNWGYEAMQGFGESRHGVDAWFDNMEAHLEEVKGRISDLGAATELKLTGAALKGSADAYKIVAQASTAGMVESQTLAKQQLREQQKGNMKLDRIEKNTAHGGVKLGRI